MTTVKSDRTRLDAPGVKVYEKLSNLENLKSLLAKIPADQIPEDRREMFENLEVTADAITIPTGMVGNLTLKITDRLPHSLIQLSGEGAPVAMNMQLQIDDVDSGQCDVQVVFNIDIPVIMKPMVSGPLKKVVDQFATVLKAIPFD